MKLIKTKKKKRKGEGEEEGEGEGGGGGGRETDRQADRQRVCLVKILKTFGIITTSLLPFSIF